MPRTYYVTTPIYYVNDVPHIGHLYTTVAADVLSRFHKQLGHRTFFLTGTDEHGQKVQQSAEKRGIPPKAHCDEMSAAFQRVFQEFSIRPDRFIRTTDPDHEATVTEIVKRLLDSGDIYPGEYEGWYSTADEEFVAPNLVKDGKDAEGRELVYLKERSYFFALSRFQERLLELIDADLLRIRPDGRRNEVLSFVRGGLKDVSITRTSISWGVPLPTDPEHVIYVWVDALINYVSGLGYHSHDPKFRAFWPADVHLVGKDIIRFHCVIWPALLMAAGMETPRMVFAHGWWTNQGRKMSKTLGNFVSPGQLLEHYDVDSIRYFLLREIPFGEDGDFSHKRMTERLNADLANDLGNALNRVLGLLNKYYGDEIPSPAGPEDLDRVLTGTPPGLLSRVENLLADLQFDEALKEIWTYVSAVNKYIDSSAPWTLFKHREMNRLGTVLYNCVESLRFIALLVAPFMPEKAQGIWSQLGFSGVVTDARLHDAVHWGRTTPGQKTSKGAVLFNKIEETPVTDTTPAPVSAPAAPTPTHPAAENLPAIPYDTFAQVQLRAGKILAAERVLKSDKLLKLQVDLGDEKRQVVAGIGKAYEPETLIGKQIVIVANLQPAKIFGVESQGMLLACGDTNSLKLATFDGEVTEGTRVK